MTPYGRKRSLLTPLEWLLVIGVLVLLGLAVFGDVTLGIAPFGPEKKVSAQVIRTYVDVSKSGESTTSHYMVTTTAGTFEVQNSLVLGIWNADEIYGALTNGGRYEFTTKGNKVLFLWIQEYPWITKAVPHTL